MSTPHELPKANVIEFSKYQFLRSRACNIKIVDSTASMVDGDRVFYIATDASQKLYEGVPFNHPSFDLVYPPPNEDDHDG